MQKKEPCAIVSLDEPSRIIKALYNPNKLKIHKGVQWASHNVPGGDAEVREFTHGQARELTIELFFDGYEENIDIEAAYINKIEELMLATIPQATPPDTSSLERVRDRESGGGAQGGAQPAPSQGAAGGSAGGSNKLAAVRPHFVMVAWGSRPKFIGIILSLDADYSLFFPDGRAARGTCSLKLVELNEAQLKKR